MAYHSQLSFTRQGKALATLQDPQLSRTRNSPAPTTLPHNADVGCRITPINQEMVDLLDNQVTSLAAKVGAAAASCVCNTTSAAASCVWNTTSAAASCECNTTSCSCSIMLMEQCTSAAAACMQHCTSAAASCVCNSLHQLVHHEHVTIYISWSIISMWPFTSAGAL